MRSPETNNAISQLAMVAMMPTPTAAKGVIKAKDTIASNTLPLLNHRLVNSQIAVTAEKPTNKTVARDVVKSFSKSMFIRHF